MHALCSLRKLPQSLQHSSWHRLLHCLHRLYHELQQAHGTPSKQLQLCRGKPSTKNQEVHHLQRFPSTFQRPGFIPLSCTISRAELQQLLGRALGHGRTAAGMPRLSLYPGRLHGSGEMRAPCHGEGCLSQPSIAGMQCYFT